MEQPNYYAVLPAGVRYDKRLKPMEKLIYAELTCLCQRQGYCWATNAYFAVLYDASKETVSRWFAHLQDCGYIKISIDQAYENGRRITLFDGSNVKGVDENVMPPHDEKVMPPHDKKVNHNNTSNNTTSKNKEIDKSISSTPRQKSGFIKPTIEQVAAYCTERRRGVDPKKWYNHYTSNGWMVGRTKMVDWKAAVRTWEKDKPKEERILG